MQCQRVVLLTVLISALGLAIIVEAQTKATAVKPKQVLEGRVEVTITGIDKIKEWKMFPGTAIERTITAEGGRALVLVHWEVKDINTGKPNFNEYFKDFMLEDDKGNKFESALKSSNLRECPVAVPPEATLSLFRMSGLVFDIRELAKNSVK